MFSKKPFLCITTWPSLVLMLLSSIWAIIPFIKPSANIIISTPRVIDVITTSERRFCLHKFLQPSMIKVFIAYSPRYSCRIALSGFSFDARRAGAIEKRTPNRKVNKAVVMTLFA